MYEASQSEEPSHESDDDEPEANFLATPSANFKCRMCQAEFYSNNKLHRHVRLCQKERKNAAETVAEANYGTVGNIPIVDSTATITSDGGYNFRRWHYATMLASHTPNGELKKICGNSGCTMSLVDRQHLLAARPEIEIKRTTKPIKVHGIGKTLHDSSEYVELDFYIPGKAPNGTEAIAHFKREVHVVDDLRANVLLVADILGPESTIINMGRKSITFPACGDISAPLDITSKGTRVTRSVRSAAQLTIPANSCIAVPIKTKGGKLPVDRDYSFHPKEDFRDLGPEGGFFSHITDANFSAVQVRNTSSQPYILPKNAKVGMLRDFEEEGCYLAAPEDRHLAAVSSRSWTKTFKKLAVAGLAAFAGLSTISSMKGNPSTSVTDVQLPAAAEILTQAPAPVPETTMPNGITIYGNTDVCSQLSAVADSYPNIWKAPAGTVKVPEERGYPYQRCQAQSQRLRKSTR